MVALILIIGIVVLVFIGLPFYLYKRRGYNFIADSAEALLELVRSLMP